MNSVAPRDTGLAPAPWPPSDWSPPSRPRRPATCPQDASPSGGCHADTERLPRCPDTSAVAPKRLRNRDDAEDKQYHPQQPQPRSDQKSGDGDGEKDGGGP